MSYNRTVLRGVERRAPRNCLCACEPARDSGYITVANGVSKDGQVWVGYAEYWDTGAQSGNFSRALKNGASLGHWAAFGANGGGSRVVGQSHTMCFHPYMGYYKCYPAHAWPGGYLTPWDTSDPNAPIPTNGVAYSVTDDGKVVVGAYAGAARRWTITSSGILMENLNTTYASLLSAGSSLKVAHDISSNGRYIVGMGYNATTARDEAFLLDTWSPCPLVGQSGGYFCTEYLCVASWQ
jgi:uncharacterized membrane protein